MKKLLLSLSLLVFSVTTMERDKDNYTRRMVSIADMHPKIAQWASEFNRNSSEVDSVFYFIPDIQNFMMTIAEKNKYFEILNLGYSLEIKGLEDESEQCYLRTYYMMLNAWIKFKVQNPAVELQEEKTLELRAALEQYRKLIGR